MGFSRQEYWNGLSFPSPGDLFNPGIKPQSPALLADSLPYDPPGIWVLVTKAVHKRDSYLLCVWQGVVYSQSSVVTMTIFFHFSHHIVVTILRWGNCVCYLPTPQISPRRKMFFSYFNHVTKWASEKESNWPTITEHISYDLFKFLVIFIHYLFIFCFPSSFWFFKNFTEVQLTHNAVLVSSA